ncbi:MAG: nucleoid-associated protein, partial [Anaerovoracaceae bacterium]
MMIQRAILHILDFYSDVSVFSEAEIDLSDEAAAGYISKQMEKLQNNPSGRRGGFSPASEFLADLRKYRSEELSFAEFSAQTARILHRYLSLAGEERPVDVLFADFSEEDSR